MKKLLFLAVALFATALQAQESKNEKTVTIDVNTDMFVQIVFKTPVQSLRVGMPNVVEAQYNDNIITVQALVEELKTNLTVKTSDGMYYSFILKGTTEVPRLFYEITPLQAVNAAAPILMGNIPDKSEKVDNKKQELTTPKSIDEKVLDKSGYLSNRNVAEYRKVELSINGVYINNGKLYFLMQVRNRSNIRYNVNKLSFATASIKKAKKQIDEIGRAHV